MSNIYIPNGYNYEQEIADAYAEASTFHRTVDTTPGETDDNGLSRGYTDGYTAGNAAGIITGEANEIRPHFIAGLTANYSAASGDVIYTLPTTSVLSSKDVTRSGSTFTINSSGTWEFFFLCSWAIQGSHAAQNTIFTKAYIYEGGTVRGRGVVRRRSGQDWFGAIGASWRGTVTAGDQFTCRIEFDWNSSTSMTVYRYDTDIDSVSIPTNGIDRGSYNTYFGPDCRFGAIKDG